tara:strand:+ start:5290 stop:6183 length:894 start_codon:yes stop_codon:yes gene_type:complete
VGQCVNIDRPVRKFYCECGREYASSGSLVNHRKKCDFMRESNITVEKVDDPGPETKNEIVSVSEENTTSKDLTTVMMKMMEIEEKRIQKEEKNHEIMMKHMEQINELAKKPTTVNNNINNRLNINVFLNDKCKDAMNLTDFVDTLKYRLEDLERIGTSGYVEGVSHMMVEGLKGVDVTMRPIHCTDLKRDSLYIKDNDEWTKEDANGSKMKKAIRKLTNNNVKNIKQWQEKNPRYQDITSKTHGKYIEMCDKVMGGATDSEDQRNYKKILKKVASEVVIQKKDSVLQLDDDPEKDNN